ncbi:MAG: hypothetical protein AAFY11_01105 [Cyanobacteria bacterium J06641_5]
MGAIGRRSEVDRLTCNRIFRYLAVYSQQDFSGCLQVSCPRSQTSWRLYLCWGRLAWATGGEHPLRRWCRQLYSATGKKPSLPPARQRDRPYWDYLELYRLSQEALSAQQVGDIVRGVLAEVLFDIVQASEQTLIARVNGYSSLLDISVLADIGENLSVTVESGELPHDRRLPPTWHPTVAALRQEVQPTWQQWVTAGLASHSPNHAPIVRDRPALQRKTNPKAFANLVRLLDGARSLRDISLRFREDKNLLKAARGLAPHICEGLITLDAVEDWLEPRPAPASEPTVACITRTRHTLEQVEFLATQAGYRFIWLSHPFEALYKFEQKQLEIPTLLFVTIDLLPLSGEEFCTLLRRLPALRAVPIVLHSRGPIPYARQQKLIELGATELLFGDMLDAAKLWQQLTRLHDAGAHASTQYQRVLDSH